jgi:CubicO group peptidase (beta-lactamase class C family)
MKNILLAAFITSLFYSCKNTDSNKINTSNNTVDSTKYFDSLDLPIRIKLNSFFQSKANKALFNGNVLFAQDNRIVFEKSYGFYNPKKKDSLSLENTFQMASASKPFTAIAILQLCERGLLKLEDSIQKYIPKFPYKGIDIHQLLCHRSGLSQYTHFCDSPDTIWPDKNKTISNDNVIEIINSIKPIINYPPNKRYYYCNTNYLLLASIVEIASELSFNDYLNKFIFNPAKMKHTHLFTRDNFNELHLPVSGYNANYRKEDNIYLNGCYGDKGIYSNVHDLLNFDIALKNGTLVSKETYSLAIKNYNDNFKQKQNYGYGFRLLYSKTKGRIVFHTGWWKGFRTYFIQVKDYNQTIIVLSNIKRGPFLKVEELANLLPGTIAD